MSKKKNRAEKDIRYFIAWASEVREQHEELLMAHKDFIFSLRAAVVNTTGQEYWTKVTSMAYANLDKLGIDTRAVHTEYPEGN